MFAPDPMAVIAALKSAAAERRSRTIGSKLQARPHDYRVIKKFVDDSPQKTLDDFDFTIVCVTYDGKDFINHGPSCLDIAQCRIIIANVVKPLNTLKRALKYASRRNVVDGESNQSHESQLGKPDEKRTRLLSGWNTFREID